MIEEKGDICIIGTSHIAQQSVLQVKEAIINLKPKIVALELDPKRFASLMSKKRKMTLRDIRYLGVRGFIFNIIGASIERRLGRLVKTPPGSEIKAAVESAKQVDAKLALIDQDISITLKRLTSSLTWKEKFRFIKEVVLALFKRSQRISFDLRKVPDQKVVQKLTDELKKKYPSVYRTLITERNEHMAKALNKISADYPQEKIVAIVGAGHIEGILKMLD